VLNVRQRSAPESSRLVGEPQAYFVGNVGHVMIDTLLYNRPRVSRPTGLLAGHPASLRATTRAYSTSYDNGLGDEVNLYIAYYASQRKGASVHSPKTCLSGGGWRMKERSRYAIDVPVVGSIWPTLPDYIPE
jgi:hypothetical protein